MSHHHPVHADASAEDYYVVPMFPYPSGALHMGHARNYAIADAYARHARAMGHHVLFPIGWDSFGLPAENAARLHGADPRAWTEANIASMREQLKAMDISFDWEHELATHEPEYYRHTQAIFCALMERGLIYRAMGLVWWDPVDQTVLANEQIIDGKGWRSGAVAIQIQMPMYYAKTTAYAQEMAEAELEWSHGAKADHLAWIGARDDGGFRLHDWSLSRHRSWGTPVPAIECASCGSCAMPASMLPHTHERMGAPMPCPRCKGPANASDETLDTFFDSAWYFLRYPEIGASSDGPVGAQTQRWAPVDLYVGGREHATMHMLYARFMSRAMADCGWEVPREPFDRYMSQGMVKARAYSRIDSEGRKQWCSPDDIDASDPKHPIHAPDSTPAKNEGVQKMSKSKLNGIDPARVAASHGVDAMRLYMFFAAPFEYDIDWSESALSGCSRFLNRFEAIAERLANASSTHKGSETDAAALKRAHQGFIDHERAQYRRHHGLGPLVAQIMSHSAAIDESKAPVAMRRGFFLDACRALAPMSPSTARACALKIDPDWSETWAPQDEAPAAATCRINVQAFGKHVKSIEAPAGMDSEQAIEHARTHCPELGRAFERAGIDPADASAFHALWIGDRALSFSRPKPASKPTP